MRTRLSHVLAIAAVLVAVGYSETQKIQSGTSRVVSFVPLSLFPATVAEAETHLENLVNGIRPRPLDDHSMSEITVALDGCVLTWTARYNTHCDLTTGVPQRQMGINLVTAEVWGMQSSRPIPSKARGDVRLPPNKNALVETRLHAQYSEENIRELEARFGTTNLAVEHRCNGTGRVTVLPRTPRFPWVHDDLWIPVSGLKRICAPLNASLSKTRKMAGTQDD